MHKVIAFDSWKMKNVQDSSFRSFRNFRWTAWIFSYESKVFQRRIQNQKDGLKWNINRHKETYKPGEKKHKG